MTVTLPEGITNERAAEKLLIARDYIRENGWAQGSYEVEPRREVLAEVLETVSPDLIDIILVVQTSDNDAPVGAVCAVGAMSRASGYAAGALYQTDEWLLRVFATVVGIAMDQYSLMHEGVPDGVDSGPEFAFYLDSEITRWNDDNGRTVEDVITAFEQAAAAFKDGEGVVAAND